MPGSRNWSTLTANRDLTLSNKLTASGVGSVATRAIGDVVTVVRQGVGAFNLVVKNHAAATLYTFTGAGSAGTFKQFEWDGTAWTVY